MKILDGPQQLAADVNRDGRINVVDAYLVRCYAAQLINEFPAA
ncbi:MAG: dockerin type I domain-containing protein [Gemmiger formicilis]